MRQPLYIITICCCILTMGVITPEQVLVVYNSPSPDASNLTDAYLAAHPDLPAGNFFDLNDPTLSGVADLTYDEFVLKIRDPIRQYIDSAGGLSASSLVSIVLIRGIPHRILDTDVPYAGDDPMKQSSEFNVGDATAASVDTELALLWQDLDAGEADGSMDSYADNLIDNPYHANSLGIDTFSRNHIRVQKSLKNTGGVAWLITGSDSAELTPGDLYLVCRIDGTTADDALNLIQRAQNINFNQHYGWILLDEDARTNHLDDDDLFGGSIFSSGADYEQTDALLTSYGWNVLYDNSSRFVYPADIAAPVIGYAGYGENHISKPVGYGTYIDSYLLAPGAIFNTYESYNARAFNGLDTRFTQEQVADFITAGGTFAIGNVWEPFSFTIADNEFLMGNFLVHGFTWAEAAWSSMPVLSWQQIVIGDPLARVNRINQRQGDFNADGAVDNFDIDFFDGCFAGPGRLINTPGCVMADLDGDIDTDQNDFAMLQRCRGSAEDDVSSGCDLSLP